MKDVTIGRMNADALTIRQINEIEYHKNHAAQHADILSNPFSYDVLFGARKWWNAYWEMYDELKRMGIAGKRVLVVGCGFGDDAIRLAKMGAIVDAFDLSPDSLAIARALAKREDFNINFREMPAEKLDYLTGEFDIVLARDILHHVDIRLAMSEIVRVTKTNGTIIINEIYTHSWADKIRNSSLVRNRLYPMMRNFVYKGAKPYITADERKLSQIDMGEITDNLNVESKRYFNAFVTRLVPDSYPIMNRFDRVVLSCVGFLGGLIAGRVLVVGRPAVREECDGPDHYRDPTSRYNVE